MTAAEVSEPGLPMPARTRLTVAVETSGSSRNIPDGGAPDVVAMGRGWLWPSAAMIAPAEAPLARPVTAGPPDLSTRMVRATPHPRAPRDETFRAYGSGGDRSGRFGVAIARDSRPCAIVPRRPRPGRCCVRIRSEPSRNTLEGVSHSRDLRVNQMIRIPQVRVVDEEGAQLGVMPTPEALAMAQERGYDLVEVAPMASPPVVKFLDFGQYKYELTKREKEAKRRQRSVTFKEVRLTPKIGSATSTRRSIGRSSSSRTATGSRSPSGSEAGS